MKKTIFLMSLILLITGCSFSDNAISDPRIVAENYITEKRIIVQFYHIIQIMTFI